MAEKLKPCRQCQGSGLVYEDGRTHYMYSKAPQTACPTCGGSGHVEPERYVLGVGWPIPVRNATGRPDSVLLSAWDPVVHDGNRMYEYVEINWPKDLAGRYRLILERTE